MFPLLGMVLLSCSAPSYRPEVRLTENVFRAADGFLRGRVPEGWFAPEESDVPPHIGALLVRDDFAATIMFHEIKVDSATSLALEREGLSLLADLSVRLKQGEEPSVQLVTEPRTVTIRGKQFVRYEYRSTGRQGQGCVAVFRVKNRYFESTAMLVNDGTSADDPLSFVQQAVILSLEE